MSAWTSARPPAAAAAAARWTRNSEFLVYLVPVGAISQELYAGYVALLQQHCELPISALTRPGGYAAELSPFKSFSWQSSGAIRFRFVSTTERIESCDGDDVHAWNRPIGVIGICHSPSTPSLADAYAQFTSSIKHFPSTLVQKCFAFEHEFDDATVEQVAALSHLVMFPVHHTLDAGGSTVSLHLGVVLDTIAVTILLSLESTIRAAMRQQAQSQAHSHHHTLPFQSSAAALEFGDMASFLLDTNVEPSSQTTQHQSSTSLILPTATGTGTATAPSQSLHAALSSMASTAVSTTASALAAPFTDTSRSRKRQIARHRKLFGDYSVLLDCIPDAIEHYTVALELLRDEERKSSGSSGDVLWLAAALEGFVYCLVLESKDQLVVDVFERAAEAVALYAKAGVSDLECQLIEKLGWYCVAVASQLEQTAKKTCGSGVERISEAVWLKRVLWDVLDRGLLVAPALTLSRQLEFVVTASRMLESIGHRRRMALFLHEAAALLVARTSSRANSGGAVATPPTMSAASMLQRQKDLHAALLLEQLTAARLGIQADHSSSRTTTWAVTTLAQSTKTRRGASSVDCAASSASHDSDVWLILRLHVLRQLLTIATLLQDPVLVARACLQLLHMLPWCDALATDAKAPSTSSSKHRKPAATSPLSSSSLAPIDQLQEPFTASLRSRTGALERQGLFLKTSVYYAPPSSIEIKTKRVFSLAGASTATMSSAAASLSSTIASTPRIMLTAPRQQFSAAVSAISTKASPAFASFGHHSHASPHSFSSSASTSASSTSVSPGVHTGLSSIGSDMTTLSPALSPPVTHDGTGKDTRSQAASSSSSSSTPNGASASRLDRGPDAPAAPVWNIRSRTDVVRMERSVLRLLETECASLRPSEQVTLPTFLHVDAMRVVAARAHPFVPRAEALAKYAPAVDSNGETPVAAAASDFFYSPFEKRAAASASTTSSSSTSTTVFPVYEKIALELVISNPFGVAIDVQQATAWVEYVDDRSSSSASSSSASTAVECYPCAMALAPYEQRKAVVLGIQPLRQGAFVVRGCFLKALNLKLSCALETPLGLDVVGRLPLVALSVCEVGRLAHPSTSSKPMAERTDALRLSMFASETKQCELRIRNVSASAITRCRLAATVRRRQVVKQTLVVFSNLLGSATAARDDDHHSASGSSAASSPFVQVVETDSITLRCTALNHSSSSGYTGSDKTVPLRSGDVVSLQFEILLRQSRAPRTVRDDEPLEEEDEIVWTLVYADDDDGDHSQSQEVSAPPMTVYYRETTLALTLMSLPSLTLSAATLVPATPESIPTSRRRSVARRDDVDWSYEQQQQEEEEELDCRRTAGLDNTHVLLVVQVENPTETAFRLRMRRRRRQPPILATEADDSADDEDDGSGDEDAEPLGYCDVEIGRKCSRRLAIELPRVHPLSQLLLLPASAASNGNNAIGTTPHGSHRQQQQQRRMIADVLNALVAIEWETYFGTKGTLEFAHALWQSRGTESTASDDDAATLELLAPEFAFEISASASSGPLAGTGTGPRTSHLVPEDNDESAIPMLAAAATTTAATNTADNTAAKTTSLGHSPFVFCQSQHLSKARRRLDVQLLEFVSITFAIRWRGFEDAIASAREMSVNAQDAARASIEIRITQDGDDDDDNELASSVVNKSVVVVGMLTRVLTVEHSSNNASSSAMNDSVLDARECVVTHEIQVLFLARGDFRVSICGCAWNAARTMVREVWSHDPLYISVAE